MKIIEDPAEMQAAALLFRAEGRRIGFVPTMGALHEGHLSLLRIARAQCDVLVTSIFVNPSQFGPSEDLARYPRPLENDRALCESAACDILFCPSPIRMYPCDYSTWLTVEKVTDPLEGVLRPGHFRGVATVVLKLFNLVQPNLAVFGCKDAQQLAVIRRMVADLNIPVLIVAAPTVREADGLALSSRNVYLTPAERMVAPRISQALSTACRLFSNGEYSSEVLKKNIVDDLVIPDLFSVDYVSIADPLTLTELSEAVDGALLSIAIRTRESGTHLIDNMTLSHHTDSAR